MMKWCLLGLVGCVILAGCNSSRRSAGGRSGDSSVTRDGTTGTDATVNPDCPPTVFDGLTCTGSTFGLQCPGTVSCPCGSLPTTCLCTEGEVGFQFSCNNDCSACSMEDAGTDARPDASSGVDCGLVYDRIMGSECPLPAEVSRNVFEQFICADIRNRSPDCAAALDATLGCWLDAPLVCEDGVATFPGCPDLPPGCEPAI
ncbi:MAG: hypothetical protein AAGF12_18375 [Myxococcota bacterium]